MYCSCQGDLPISSCSPTVNFSLKSGQYNVLGGERGEGEGERERERERERGRLNREGGVHKCTCMYRGKVER